MIVEKDIDRVVELLSKTDRLVVLTGAGISAESGVPTFRGENGLWKNYRAEELATPEAFKRNPKLVWEWYGYRQNLVSKCKPNPAHYALAGMEYMFKDFTLITQNVDGLHEKAGSRNIIELHGNLFKARCIREGNVFDFKLEDDPLPKCRNCGELIRPHIVWFGESLDSNYIGQAMAKSLECQVFMVIGTSSVVYPAASLSVYARQAGAKVVEINLDPTPLSSRADISIQGRAGDIMSKVSERIKSLTNKKG